VEALYYYPRTADWWRETIGTLGLRGEVRTLRLLRPNEYRWLFGRSTWVVKWLRALELALPNATLAFAASALVRITKPVVPQRDGVSSEPQRDSRHPRAPE
ncbi:MAG: hypothetical protein KDG49_21725, partial [Geminicoccaceae bacterium]|nr:hypothetical protein [Geminicoccaceae bacterium]